MKLVLGVKVVDEIETESLLKTHQLSYIMWMRPFVIIEMTNMSTLLVFITMVASDFLYETHLIRQ